MDNAVSCYFGSHPHERPLHNSVSGECRSSTSPEVTLDIHQFPAVSCSSPAHAVVHGFKAIPFSMLQAGDKEVLRLMEG